MRARNGALLAVALLLSIGGAVFLMTSRGAPTDRDDRADLARDDMPVDSPRALAPTPLAPGSGGRRARGGRAADDSTSAPTPAPNAEPNANADGGKSGDVGRTVVVGPDGKPVAGVLIELGRFRSGVDLDMAHRFLRLDGSDPSPRDPTRGAPERARTDGDGLFDGDDFLFSLVGCPYTVAFRSLDPAWIVRSAQERSIKKIELEPAVWLSVRVVADADGSPIGEIDARVSARGSGEGFTAKNGGFVVQWPRTNEVTDVTVIVRAKGFASEMREIRIPADATSSSIEIRLKPAAPAGTLVVRTIDAPESLLARPFDLEVRAPTAGAHQNYDRVKVDRRPDGAFAVDVPAGSWHVRLRPHDGWANWTAWEQDVAIVAGRESEFTWTVPPTGTVRIEILPGVPPDSYLLFGRGDEERSANHAYPGAQEVMHVPLGTWTVEIANRELRMPPTKVSVEVRAGETAVARLSFRGAPTNDAK